LKASLEYWQVSLSTSGDPTSGASREGELPATLAEIYDTHFDFVWRNARRLGVPEASADDVTQDVFMIVQRRMASYDGRASMQAWIFGILMRVVSTHRRSIRRRSAHDVPLEQSLNRELGEAHEPSPIDQLERTERAQLIDRLLSELSEEQRSLLILCELEEWTLREIAELYGSNINTIYSRIRAAKRAFERAYSQAQAGRAAKERLR
jgi:RNA polymerase sigma-70 factor (ECF subfamily)